MRRKLKAIIKILFSERYILVTKKCDYTNFDYTMSDFEVKKYCLFIHNFLQDGDDAINEFNEIINS